MQVQAEDKWAELGEGRLEQCLDGKSGDGEIGRAPHGSHGGKSVSSLRTPQGQAPWDAGTPESRPRRLSSAGRCCLWGKANSWSFLP